MASRKNPLPIGQWITGQVKQLSNGTVIMRTANPTVKRNVEQGFFNATGFHPIRASADYERERGDWGVQPADTPKRRKRLSAKKKAHQSYLTGTGSRRKAAPKKKAATAKKSKSKAKKSARRR